MTRNVESKDLSLILQNLCITCKRLGNVRELANVMEQGVALAPETIHWTYLISCPLA